MNDEPDEITATKEINRSATVYVVTENNGNEVRNDTVEAVYLNRDTARAHAAGKRGYRIIHEVKLREREGSYHRILGNSYENQYDIVNAFRGIIGDPDSESAWADISLYELLDAAFQHYHDESIQERVERDEEFRERVEEAFEEKPPYDARQFLPEDEYFDL